jgi:hypothetical protein
MKEKLEKAFTVAQEKSPGKTLVCLIHPLKWSTLSEDEQQEIEKAFRVEVPPIERLDLLASLMGVKNDDHFWSLDKIYFSPENESPFLKAKAND